ncbi:MAG: phosphatidylglycerol lysyltransferase domain-containing protein [Eubacteriales bacterium]|nr:phosphatidylglycerol lysyltransferase domain-containing protein [Eubacteriales bacterium]
MEDINLKDLKFDPFSAEDVRNLREYFFMRPNKSCDSAPLDSFIWRNYYDVRRCVVNNECLLMLEKEDAGYAGCIPLCSEEKLPEYFKLQERYFNEVLGEPFQIYLADEEGVEVLKKAGLLENYEIREEEDLKDYLYDAEAMRTLAGRKLAKKRNHIHKFEETYAGRWEYKTLTTEDKLDILSLLASWKEQKDEVGEGAGINAKEETFDAMESLDAEILGVHEILNNDSVFENVKIGGIYIDGKLCAFSIGNYNEREKMAIIDIEKADPDVIGLYQVINQQFLIHEFPDALLVNREDDVGLEGLRRSKMSYYPIGFERKYMLRQKDFVK